MLLSMPRQISLCINHLHLERPHQALFFSELWNSLSLPHSLHTPSSFIPFLHSTYFSFRPSFPYSLTPPFSDFSPSHTFSLSLSVRALSPSPLWSADGKQERRAAGSRRPLIIMTSNYASASRGSWSRRPSLQRSANTLLYGFWALSN